MDGSLDKINVNKIILSQLKNNFYTLSTLPKHPKSSFGSVQLFGSYITKLSIPPASLLFILCSSLTQPLTQPVWSNLTFDSITTQSLFTDLPNLKNTIVILKISTYLGGTTICFIFITCNWHAISFMQRKFHAKLFLNNWFREVIALYCVYPWNMWWKYIE